MALVVEGSIAVGPQKAHFQFLHSPGIVLAAGRGLLLGCWVAAMAQQADFVKLCLQLELVQENVKYFLEIMQNKKSVLLEWFIIILIAIEIALGVYDNGLASMSFELLKTLVPGL